MKPITTNKKQAKEAKKEKYVAPQCEVIALDPEHNLVLTDSGQHNPGYGRSYRSGRW